MGQVHTFHLTECYVEQLRPAWLPTKEEQFRFQWFSGVVFGSIFGLLGGMGGGLITGLIFGLVFGIPGVLPELPLVDTFSWSWKKSFPVLVVVLIIVLVVGHRYGLVGGLVSGLIGALIVVLRFGLSGKQLIATKRQKPNQGIVNSGWNGLRIGMFVVLFFGLVFGLIPLLFFGLTFGVLFGVLFGLVFGGITYLQHYLFRFLLWKSKALPFFLVRFLNECCERVLLQRVGGGYRFIHPLFQDYFASLAADSSPQHPPSLSSPSEQISDPQKHPSSDGQ